MCENMRKYLVVFLFLFFKAITKDRTPIGVDLGRLWRACEGQPQEDAPQTVALPLRAPPPPEVDGPGDTMVELVAPQGNFVHRSLFS